jgi:pPIWI_RE module N-terminal domain/RNaseH domain of pPIWI_RE/MID domain of pPIWI_RE
MKYTHIRTSAFTLRPTARLPKYVSLEFPKHWVQPLLSWYAEVKGRSGQPVGLPIQSLNATLRALIPDLVGVQSYAGIQKNGSSQPWLYSAEPISSEHLQVILQAWVRVEFAKMPHLHQPIFDLIQTTDLIWKSAPVTLKSPGFYTLLPDVIAACLEPHAIEASGILLKWRRAPFASGESGAELISYPPLEHRGFLWSVLMTITVQTLPFQETPVIHIDLGMRRWEGRGQRQQGPIRLGGGKTSAYILTSVPWIAGMHHSRSFQAAQLQNFKTNTGFEVGWSDQLPQILQALNINHLPEPRDLLEQPLGKASDCKEDAVLITYRNDAFTRHPVEPGFSSFDRRQLIERIAAALEPILEFTPPSLPVKIAPGVAIPKNTFAAVGRQGKLTQDETKNAATNTAIQNEISATLESRVKAVRAVIPSLNIEVWSEPQGPTLPAIRTALRECFGVAERDGKHQVGTLNIDVRVEYSNRVIPDLQKNGEHEFVKHLEQKLGVVHVPTLAIIELPSKDHWQKEKKPDPQRAIRQAFARTGRIAQFIVPNTENARIRATRALLDGLRPFGVHETAAWFGRLQGFRASLGILGFWLLDHRIPTGKGDDKTHHQLPIAVYVSTENPGVFVSAPWRNGFGFIPYAEALVRIARGEIQTFGTRELRFENALSFVASTLDEFREHPNLLVLAHAQNFRRVWKWLMNNYLELDAFTLAGKRITAQNRPNWRIARIRDSTGNEVPEWFGVKADGEGPTKGVFQINKRTFYTSQSRSDTMQAPQKLTKFGDRAKPNKSAPQPNLLEVSFPFAPSVHDLPRWAALVSEMRNLSIQHNDATSLPYPLHVARKLEEYL